LNGTEISFRLAVEERTEVTADAMEAERAPLVALLSEKREKIIYLALGQNSANYNSGELRP